MQQDMDFVPQPLKVDDYGLVTPAEFRTKGVAPPGLEYLMSIDQLLVKQVIELFEVMTGFETKNRYNITNSMGQQVFFMFEESECLQRQCCGAVRGFIMHINDNMNQEVIRMTRECSCSGNWCIPCCASCASVLVVECPPGNVIGRVKQEGYFWKLKLGIYDETDNRVAVINGPCCPCTWICCPEDIDYPIVSEQGGERLAMIAKQWGGFARECWTKADNFSITFPMDMDPKMKVLMFCAVVQVEFLQFEQQKKNNG